MGAVIDLIIVVIIALTLFFSVKNGFSKTALGVLGFFIAAAVALAFCGKLGKAVTDSGLGDRIESAVDSAVDGIIDEENYLGIFENDGVDGNESALSKLFSAFGAEESYRSLRDGYNAHRDAGLAAAREYIKEGVMEKAVPFLCRLLSFLLLFFGTRLLIKIAEIIISKAAELPVLKQADKLLGALAGLLLALFRVYLFCVALKLLLPAAGAFGAGWASGVDLNDSFLYRIFESGNILSALI